MSGVIEPLFDLRIPAQVAIRVSTAFQILLVAGVWLSYEAFKPQLFSVELPLGVTLIIPLAATVGSLAFFSLLSSRLLLVSTLQIQSSHFSPMQALVD